MPLKDFLNKLFSGQPEVVQTSHIDTITFLPEVLSGEDSKFQKSKVIDNTIYCCSPAGDFCIGNYFYAETRNGDMDIYSVCDNNDIKIGEITKTDKSCVIYLISPSNPYNKFPCATVSGSIKDIENNNTIVSYNGDKLAAAAAFICMTYEVHLYTKYHQFY